MIFRLLATIWFNRAYTQEDKNTPMTEGLVCIHPLSRYAGMICYKGRPNISFILSSIHISAKKPFCRYRHASSLQIYFNKNSVYFVHYKSFGWEWSLFSLLGYFIKILSHILMLSAVANTRRMSSPIVHSLTHWDRDKIAAIFQTILGNRFSWKTRYKYRLKFQWRLFLVSDLQYSSFGSDDSLSPTMTSHYLNQWW